MSVSIAENVANHIVFWHTGKTDVHTQVCDKIVDNMLDVDVHQKLTTKLAAACSYRLAQITTEMVGKGFYQSNFSLPTMLSQ